MVQSENSIPGAKAEASCESLMSHFTSLDHVFSLVEGYALHPSFWSSPGLGTVRSKHDVHG